jgi:hypothetical protein
MNKKETTPNKAVTLLQTVISNKNKIIEQQKEEIQFLSNLINKLVVVAKMGDNGLMEELLDDDELEYINQG